MPGPLKLKEMVKIACRVKEWEYHDHDTFESVDSEVRIRITREKVSTDHPELAITAEFNGISIGSARERETSGSLHEILDRLTFEQGHNGNQASCLAEEQRNAVVARIRRSLR